MVGFSLLFGSCFLEGFLGMSRAGQPQGRPLTKGVCAGTHCRHLPGSHTLDPARDRIQHSSVYQRDFLLLCHCVIILLLAVTSWKSHDLRCCSPELFGLGGDFGTLDVASVLCMM